MNSPSQQVPNMLLENSGEITPEKNEEMERKEKQCPVVDMTGDEAKSGKEQYCIGTWNGQVHESKQIGSGQTGDGKNEH